MRFAYDDQQRAVAETARSVLARDLGVVNLLVLVEREGSLPSDLWRRLADVGMLGLLMPESHGGGGGSLLDFCAFAEEAGRALLPGPWLETCVLAPAALNCSGGAVEAHHGWLEAWAGGEATATFAHQPPLADPAGDVVAVPMRSGYHLTGAKDLVPFGDNADVAVVTGSLSGGPAVFLVPLRESVQVRAQATIDPRDSLVALTFDVEAGPDSLLCTGVAAGELVQHLLGLGTAVRCVEMLGAARAVTEITADYVRTRQQFGQPVGAFQAVKHKLATAAMHVENMAASAYAAIWAVQHGEDVPDAVSVAKAYGSQAYAEICRTAVQLHGGYGFTWESGIHLFLKHARRCSSSFGTSDRHLDILASRLLDCER